MSTFSMLSEPEPTYIPDSENGTEPFSPSQPPVPVWWKPASQIFDSEPIALDAAWNDFQEGSGSVYPLACLVQSAATGPYASWVRISIQARNIPERSASPSQMLATIKSDLSVNITELAKMMEVERPTLYSWLAEKTIPHPGNRERMGALFGIALEWRKLSKTPLGAMRHHFFESGKSLLDFLKMNPLPMDEVRDGFKVLAQLVAKKNMNRRPTGKELAKKYGIKTRSNPDEWDFISGKRIGME